jgi:hypothetical protein
MQELPHSSSALPAERNAIFSGTTDALEEANPANSMEFE